MALKLPQWPRSGHRHPQLAPARRQAQARAKLWSTAHSLATEIRRDFAPSTTAGPPGWLWTGH